jgi:hypothetical protein
MADFITEAEREAIAAYSGPIQRIPRGVSAQTTYVYDEKSTASGGLVSSNRSMSHQEWLRERVKASHRARAKARAFDALRRREGAEYRAEAQTAETVAKPAPIPRPKRKQIDLRPRKTNRTRATHEEVQARREKALELWQSGMKWAAVGRALGIDKSKLNNDRIAILRAMKAAG